MKMRHIQSFPAILLALCLACAVISCEKPTQGMVIPTPTKPSQGGGSDSGGGSGGSGGSGNSGGSGDTGSSDTPTSTGTLCTDIGQKPVVLAYYTEYSTEMPDVTRLTHINYAHGRFGNPKTGDGGIVIAEHGKLQRIVALKSQNPKLKVLLMIGGWGAHADGFSMMARDAAKRTAFCKAVKAHIDNYKLDGVDIDWEYPTQSADNETGCDPSDTQNFNLVLQELRETIGTSKIISFASSSSAKYVDWSTAIKYLDYVNVMTYDMGAAPNGHNSPLYRSSRFAHRSCDESIAEHAKKGVPIDRQVMGVPFYGKSKKNPTEAEKIFEYSVKYYEIPDILEKGIYRDKPLKTAVTRVFDGTAKVPYLSDPLGNNVLSYDDPESVGIKGQYVKDKGLLGAMFWEYRYDDANHSLLKALVQGLYGKDKVL